MGCKTKTQNTKQIVATITVIIFALTGVFPVNMGVCADGGILELDFSLIKEIDKCDVLILEPQRPDECTDTMELRQGQVAQCSGMLVPVNVYRVIFCRAQLGDGLAEELGSCFAGYEAATKDIEKAVEVDPIVERDVDLIKSPILWGIVGFFGGVLAASGTILAIIYAK